jgi:hypothetical protein
MPQNRNKLIELFIGNMSNAVIHDILEKAIDDEDIRKRYGQELNTSFKKAKDYREKINPVSSPIPEADIYYIKNKIIKKVKAGLNERIAKGYENIDLFSIELVVDSMLKEAGIK